MALTAKQEAYCQNLEIKKMSQRDAFIAAYPSAEKWKPRIVDSKACTMAKKENILARRMELRNELKEEAKKEAKWTKEDFFDTAQWLIQFAKKEAESGKKLSGPAVSAVTNMVKELNVVFGVSEDINEKDNTAFNELISAIGNIGDEDD